MSIKVKIIIALFFFMLLLTMNKDFQNKHPYWFNIDCCKNIFEKWEK